MLKQSDRLNKSEPALIVKYGNTSKRFLTLERKSVVLGRGRGCDIELDAPEISLLHCVITRGPGGLSVRDCSSRAGTKVNGDKVQERMLRNGDILLVGTFSFEVYLPWTSEPADIDVATQEAYKHHLQRLEKSRHRLTNLALTMRRRLREENDGVANGGGIATETPVPEKPKQAAGSDDTLQDQPFCLETALAARHADLNRELATLADRLRECDAKFRALEEREQALNARAAEFARREQEQDQIALQLAEVQTEQDRVRVELAGKQAEQQKAAEQFAATEKELRRQVEEQSRTQKRGDDTSMTGPLPDEIRRLELRRRELECFARHLRRTLLRHQHEHHAWRKSVEELRSLFSEACHYQHVGLQTLQQARDCVDGLRPQ